MFIPLVLCPEGSYFNTASRLCLPCGKATYQDELGQLHCKPCPMTTTTRRTGSTDYGDCEGDDRLSFQYFLKLNKI